MEKKDIALILKTHNKERRALKEKDLIWDVNLAKYARDWAMHLAENDNNIFHSTQKGSNYGENISYFTGYEFKANFGVDLWIQEREKYNNSPISYSGVNQYGHYTQVIWAETKRVGCGCAQGASGAYYFVCNYDPSGNYIGKHPYNTIRQK